MTATLDPPEVRYVDRDVNGSTDDGAPIAGDAASRLPSAGGVASTPVSRILESECLRLLGEASLGRLAFVVDGLPVVVPVNYAVDGRAFVFRNRCGLRLGAGESW